MLKQNLVLNVDWTGEEITDDQGNVIEDPVGEIEVYQEMIASYEADLKAANRDSNFEHLKKKKSDLDDKKNSLVNPIKQLDYDLKEEAYKLLTPEQRQTAALPEEPTRITALDKRVMWGLMILGGLLIAGCCTRISALAAAGMVLTFYLANPPWPGVPPAPGPEHSFIVDKNLIEVTVLISLVFLPTGSWFGVDGLFRRIFLGNKQAGSEPAPKAISKKPEPQKKTTPQKK